MWVGEAGGGGGGLGEGGAGEEVGRVHQSGARHVCVQYVTGRDDVGGEGGEMVV